MQLINKYGNTALMIASTDEIRTYLEQMLHYCSAWLHGRTEYQ
jgi:hypothetical protein